MLWKNISSNNLLIDDCTCFVLACVSFHWLADKYKVISNLSAKNTPKDTHKARKPQFLQLELQKNPFFENYCGDIDDLNLLKILKSARNNWGKQFPNNSLLVFTNTINTQPQSHYSQTHFPPSIFISQRIRQSYLNTFQNPLLNLPHSNPKSASKSYDPYAPLHPGLHNYPPPSFQPSLLLLNKFPPSKSTFPFSPLSKRLLFLLPLSLASLMTFLMA